MARRIEKIIATYILDKFEGVVCVSEIITKIRKMRQHQMREVKLCNKQLIMFLKIFVCIINHNMSG